MTTSAELLQATPEYELELEGEFEAEYEDEEFFRSIARLARRAAQNPALRRVGLAAARSALSGLGGVGAAIGGPTGSRGARIGGPAGAAIGRTLTDLLPQQELEGEWEYEVNPIRRVYPEALMEHLGHAAAASASEAEAEAFIGALVPLAARVAPQAARAIMRNAPQLVRGIAAVTRTLRRNPATRPLVRALPTVVRRTAQCLGRQAADGRPITPRTAVRTLAAQTAGVLGNPRQCAAAYRRSRALDRRFHIAAARP
ncbi:MAG TPA: hypothetical protein VGR06_24135 [Actinophytocola sp.]|jgi:hypothetical protein|uniref:hypothetical protein n=1 Tax=Actinophytocola sp. TaxID=1872138 RepID=UPI002DFE4971|nr:hypothetical protein [Actinophytocola sp.]